MYRITATAQATETAASSTSAALYYYAGDLSEGATTEYRLVVSKGSAPASSMVYDGSSVALNPAEPYSSNRQWRHRDLSQWFMAGC